MPKAAKKTTVSKGGRGKKTVHNLGGKKFKRSYAGEDPHVDIHQAVSPDLEKVAAAPDDEASKHKYPPPKKNKIFRASWLKFIDDITDRENFKVGHLQQLEILCDLLVEYDEYQTFIRKRGRTYKSVGRNGEVWKFYPEVLQLNKVSAQIKEYMKMLSLLLRKDNSSASGGEKDEWS